MEGDQEHIAATCLPRKGKASHSCEAREQTWQQVGAASAAWDVSEEQLPQRGPCRHTWLLSSGFHPGSSPNEVMAIWQRAPLWEERGGRKRRSVLPRPKGAKSQRRDWQSPRPESWDPSRNHQVSPAHNSEFTTHPPTSALCLCLGRSVAT